MQAFAYLVFPNSIISVLRQGSSLVEGEPMEHGIITSVAHGVMLESVSNHEMDHTSIILGDILSYSWKLVEDQLMGRFEDYASYMKGNLLFEQDQNWDTALMNFQECQVHPQSFYMLLLFS
ncbi:hypothetical protein L1049_020401 [Liquidambar formosana]|uniref:Uncharacterized protein n=1 Tax=Liquidambar formosana TaxID=63359 RepID=A0AAP0S7W7_LIQFO